MKMPEIMNHLAKLALSNGFYTRLYHSIREMECMNPEGYDKLVNTLEAQNFADGLSLVLWFEQ